MSLSLGDPQRPHRSPVPGAGIWLAVGTVVLTVGVFLAPFRVASLWAGGGYGNVGELRRALQSGFVDFWSAGQSAIGPAMSGPVDFWAKFHIVKAVLAAALLVSTVLLGSRIGRAYLGAERLPRRLAWGVVGMAVATVAALALVILVANVQGAVVPLSSVLGLMPVGSPDPGLSTTLTQVRSGLGSGDDSPPLNLLVHDFAAYHIAMVVLGTLVTVALTAAVVVIWRRRRRTPRTQRRERRLLAVAAGLLVPIVAFFALVTVANASTVARPAPALLGFFEGSA